MNSRRRRFCELYVQGMSAAQAAREAGYSPRTAKTQGQRLLTFADVKDYIAELQDQLSREAIADAEEVLTQVSSILRDPQQRPGPRLRAGEVLLKYTKGGGMDAPAAGGRHSLRDVEPNDEDDVTIILPWNTRDLRYCPGGYLDGDGGIVRFETPPPEMLFVLTQRQIRDMEARFQAGYEEKHKEGREADD